MGEVFNGNTGYVGDYQNHLTGVFNYPMFFTIKMFLVQDNPCTT
jgi:hypothetical protein